MIETKVAYADFCNDIATKDAERLYLNILSYCPFGVY